jgi:hypothetical protein
MIVGIVKLLHMPGQNNKRIPSSRIPQMIGSKLGETVHAAHPDAPDGGAAQIHALPTQDQNT